MGVEGARHLATYLSMADCVLQDLDIRFNGIREEGTLAILEAIKGRTHAVSRDGSGSGPSHLMTLNLQHN